VVLGIGAAPAMVFLGVVMMPFYYGAKERTDDRTATAVPRAADARHRCHRRGGARGGAHRQPFDIRRIIGALFVLYGVILVVTGAFGSEEIKNKAAGINVDLWTGLGMLVVGALMIFWALARPVAPEPPQTRGRGSGRIRRSPAT